MWIAHSKLIHCDTCTCRADTQNVVMYDDATSSYAAYIRIDRRETDDNPHAGNVSCPGPNEFKYIKRRIGRCDLADLSKPWTCNQSTAKMVLSFDRFDPVCFDLYSSAATKYEGRYLFFPSAFGHTVYAGDDGVLDIRLASSRSGVNASYPPARNGRAPFVSLEPDTCTKRRRSTVNPANLSWCDGTQPGSLAHTSAGTSMLWMAAGFVTTDMHHQLYYSTQPFTHGEVAPASSGANNTGIRRAELRKDGFVSVNAGYSFPLLDGTAELDIASLPWFETVPLRPPACAHGHAAALRLNYVSSAVGLLFAELRSGGAAFDAGYAMRSSDPMRGNALWRKATWGGGKRWALPAGGALRVRVAMTDAQLFSLTLVCEAQ